MAEINNSFFQGKMNKDLDERLIPNGQYRDALNIEVSTSDDNDVGTVQAVRGNTLVSGDSAPTGSSIVGEITDEKNNCIYYFVSGPEITTDGFAGDNDQPSVSKDLILKYDSSTNTMTNVFTDVYSYLAVFDVDDDDVMDAGTDINFNLANKTITVPNTSAYKDNLSTNMYVNVYDKNSGVNHVWNNRIINISTNILTLENEISSLATANFQHLVLHITHKNKKRALNFNKNYYITGINIVEDFLIWTDNNSEPKKISIPRSIAGTTNANTTTKLSVVLNADGTINTADYPLTTGKKADETHTTVIRKSPVNSPDINIKQNRSNVFDRSTEPIDMSIVNNDDTVEVEMSSSGLNPFLPNDILHLSVPPTTPTKDIFDVRLKVQSLVGTNKFKAKILSGGGLNSTSAFNIFLFEEESDLFKDKFSFFATRYKYTDGEYSTFSPFSEAAFLPGNFLYDSKEAFNIGMQNKLKEIEITNIITPDIPEDVVQVDILYTESNSPEIYKVDSIRKDSNNDTYWADNKYIITKENIYSLLEEKQLLRQWDNVPKKALAQEVVGNRIVYGNYTQNYNTPDENIKIDAYIDNRVFTGPELLPNRFMSENFDNYTQDGNNNYTHIRLFSDNNRKAGSVKCVASDQFAKFNTDTSVDILENDKTYYYSFLVTNWTGTGELQGPALMSGTSGTDGTGRFANFQKSITGNGYYSGQATLSSIRNSAAGAPWSNDLVRQFMFQVGSDPAASVFTCHISNFSLKEVITNTKKSVKSQRNYKLGVVYADEYGRETPVLTGKTASVSVPKLNSVDNNCIKAKITSFAPNWATHFKYFVKETSSEYYNIALDRIYKADSKGDSYWLSFPSTERNKLDEETFLILKKGHGDNGVAVTDENAIYKVLDISANAPDFIKQNFNSIGLGGINANINTGLFDDVSTRPITGDRVVSFDKNNWIGTEGNPDLTEIISTKDIVVKFKDNNNRVSDIFNIDSIQVITAPSGNEHYKITFENKFEASDISWIMTSSNLSSGVVVEVLTVKIENKPEFDGRFFAKVNADAFITDNVYSNSTNSVLAQVLSNNSLFYKSGPASLNLDSNYQSFNVGAGGALNNLINFNNYSNSRNKTNAISIHNISTVSAQWDDLTSFDFLTYDSSSGHPFAANLNHNDTLYFEARSWFDSGDNGGGGTQQAGNGKNIYKAIPHNLAFMMSHIDTTSLPLNFSTVGVSGIQDNIVGVDQSSVMTDAAKAGTLRHAAFSYSYGLFQRKNGTNGYSIYGSIGSYMKFLRIFKFGVATTGNDLGEQGEYGSNWFIDNMSYIGIQQDTSYNPETHGKYYHFHRAVHYAVNNSNKLEMAANDGTAFGNNLTQGKNDYTRTARGIYTATQEDVDADIELYGNAFHEVGEPYIQISFGGMPSDISYSLFDPDDLSALETALASSGWTSTSNSFLDMVNSIAVGKKFKFEDDPVGNQFEIKDFKIVKRYNHTPFPGNSHTYYQYFDDNAGIQNITFSDLRDPSTGTYKKFRARTTHNTTNNFALKTIGDGSSSTVPIIQESITDEEKRFCRGSNRRLTYIIKLDRLPDNTTFVPTNDAGGTVAGKMDGNTSRILQFIGSVTNEETQLTTTKPAIFETEPKETEGLDIYYEASDFYDIKDHGNTQDLSYYNCYSFNNGVESDRIKDVFNKASLGKGIVASTTLDEVYKEDTRGSGLIFSGIYNSTSNVNDLNQFLTAEIITKDINPTYGTIQKLHTKDSNLLVLCEDKVLKILANKDALFNADGNPQLTANTNVLGQTIPYVGEFGISKDPRSFASQSHRSYFTDKQRGVVLRLSMDGLTAISQYGMADFFRDNLPISTALIGSYDARKNEYNLKLDTAGTDYVISFNENIKGFSSFKSFTNMQAGISLNNEYYTFKDAELWKHHSNNTRANFYGSQYYPELTLVLNADPYKNKRFKTITYEGTQAKVDRLDVTTNGSDADFYNIEGKPGWYVDDLETDIPQTGSVNEFLEKGNKWYNYIKGDDVTASNIDTSDFNVQGLSIISSNTSS